MARRAILVVLSLFTASVLLALDAAPAYSTPSEGETSNVTIAHTITDVGEAIDTWFPAHGISPRAGRCVAQRESGMQATPRENIYSGTFQHLDTEWLGRVRRYNARNDLKTPDEDWRNPTTMALVTAEMVAKGGWGPWPNTARECGLRASRSRRARR